MFCVASIDGQDTLHSQIMLVNKIIRFYSNLEAKDVHFSIEVMLICHEKKIQLKVLSLGVSNFGASSSTG